LTNEEQIILYLPLTIVFGILLCSTLLRNKGRFRGDRSLYFIVCLFVWQCLELLPCFLTNPFWIRYVLTLKLVPLSFLPVTFIFFSFSFYRIKRFVPRWTLNAALIIPALVTVFALIPATSSFLISNFQITGSLENFTVADVEYGFGFLYYIDLVYKNIVYVAIGYIVIHMFRRLPAAYRRGSLFHLLCLGILIAMQALYYTGRDTLGFDAQYYGLSICGLLFYLTQFLNSDTSSLSIDQSSIFNFLDQAVFILNEDGVIVEANRPAVLWLKSLGRPVENITFDGLLSVLINNHRILIKKLEDSDDSDLHFIGTAIPLIYRMERRVFVMSDKITKGEFVTLTDVTRNRLLIDRLRDMAGVDALTGTANRYRYQDLLRKLDRTENYPLAVVIGDVNGLKYVNDTFGHHVGDQYIKDVAAVLVDCCPRKGYVARYGGDEFATLLVNSPPEAVEDYIDNVNKTLQKPIEGAVQQPSISMGYAIKHHGNENLNALIGQADQKMYADKMARKAAEREALEDGTV
jgi:diguanylate cyclase (GGDEF)-like protein